MIEKNDFNVEARVNDLALTLRGLIGSRPVALFDWPNYANAGDHFIWLGQKVLLKHRLGCKIIYECSLRKLDMLAVTNLPTETILVMQGGGNFGDLYDEHQRFRDAIITAFPDRRTVIMPQTAHFRSPERLEQSARRLKLHPDLHVIVRDQESFTVVRSEMGLANCYLHIDAAFALQPIVADLVTTIAAKAERDVVYLLRRDAETNSKISPGEADVRYDWGRASDLTKFVVDLPSPKSIALSRDLIDGDFDEYSWQRFCAATRCLNEGRRIVTDRLHGHILAVMMQKPHDLYDNSYGKNRSFYMTWTRSCPLVTFVNT